MSQLQKDLCKVEAPKRSDSLYKLLREKYTKARRPLSGTFELTNHCTLNCRMCYVHPSTGTVNRPKIGTDQWIDVMGQAIDAGMLYATLTGGECFTHPGFREIYEFLYHRGVKVTIKSNGTLIDQKTADWLAARKPQQVDITLYGSNPAVYASVTGVGQAFEKVNRAIDLLTEREIKTRMFITAIRQNIHDVDAILALAKSRKVGRIRIEPTTISPRPGVENDAGSCALTYHEKVEMWKKNLELLDRQVFDCVDYDSLAANLPKQSEEKADILRGMPCTAGMCSFSVTSEGMMQPCVEYPLANAKPFETGFDEAWRAVNEAAHAYNRTPECMSCQFMGYCSFCPSRYALMTGGYGHPGILSCVKRDMAILPMLEYKEECEP